MAGMLEDQPGLLSDGGMFPPPGQGQKRDWSYYAGPHLAQGVRNVGGLAEALLNLFGPGADVKGMVGDSAEAMKAARGGDMLGAASNLGMAAAAVPMMFLPGSVAGVKDAVKGIRAYHGSPHDFDRFDLSKIGTGEGAQAYGHGLYFAEREGVAKSYRDALTQGGVSIKKGAEWSHIELGIANRVAQAYPGDLDAMLVALNNQASRYSQGEPLLADAMRSVAGKLQNGDFYFPPSGKMYEVNLRAAPEQFLDWDKPLREQGESIAKSVKSVIDPGGYGPPTLNVNEGGLTGNELLTALKQKDLAEKFRGMPDVSYRPDVVISQALREAGIPGIRYLDQGSRAAGEGSSNYVVFDPEIIEIMRKYGILPAMLGGGAAAGMLGGTGEAEAGPR